MSEPALLVCARRLRAARGVVVARDVTLTAAPGDVVAIEGPNGSGKSTLLAAAAGLLPADRASVRPGSVGYSPERAGVLPRVPLRSWLLGLARTAGLDRHESARRAGDLLDRLGLAHASAVSLHALSRGNAQRALVAQALLADPDLLILDEPAGGMDADGVSRVAAEIQRAASRRAVVLVARHPTAPLPLPSGLTWRLHEGTVDTRRRESDGKPLAAGTMEVETGDGTVRLVDEAALVAPLISQGEHPHPALLDGKIVLLHLAAAVFGAGIGSLLALIERAGWRLLAAVALYLVLFVARLTPMTPLLRLSTTGHAGNPGGRPGRVALPSRPGPDGAGRAAGCSPYLAESAGCWGQVLTQV